jgi:hypothetical protein
MLAWILLITLGVLSTGFGEVMNQHAPFPIPPHLKNLRDTSVPRMPVNAMNRASYPSGWKVSSDSLAACGEQGMSCSVIENFFCTKLMVLQFW